MVIYRKREWSYGRGSDHKEEGLIIWKREWSYKGRGSDHMEERVIIIHSGLKQ